MSDLYAMRRANGDWFALENHGRLRVPLFHSSHDAIMGRLHNFGMLLFAPVALNARSLAEIAPAAASSDVDFCLVKDPFTSLGRGGLLELAQVASLIGDPDNHRSVPTNGNGSRELSLSAVSQSEWWN